MCLNDPYYWCIPKKTLEAFLYTWLQVASAASPSRSSTGITGTDPLSRFQGSTITEDSGLEITVDSAVKKGNAGPKLHGSLWEKSGFLALACKRYFLVENKRHDGSIWAKRKLFLTYCL